MSKLPDGWTQAGKPGGLRVARCAGRVVVIKPSLGRAYIDCYGGSIDPDAMDSHIRCLNEAATIARQWDEEMGAK